MTTHSHTARIRELNDLCRTAPGFGGTWMITQGIEALPMQVQSKLREAVETYANWTPDDDPYGEHDFGAFEIDGHRCFFKISYYDKALTYHSPDPADPTVTQRVLTLMLASEY